MVNKNRNDIPIAVHSCMWQPDPVLGTQALCSPPAPHVAELAV